MTNKSLIILLLISCFLSCSKPKKHNAQLQSKKIESIKCGEQFINEGSFDVKPVDSENIRKKNSKSEVQLLSDLNDQTTEFKEKTRDSVCVKTYDKVCNVDILDKEEAFQRRLWALKCKFISEDTVKSWHPGSTIENSIKYPAIFIDDNVYTKNSSEKYDETLVHVFSSAYPRSGYPFIKSFRAFPHNGKMSYHFDDDMCVLPKGANRYTTCEYVDQENAKGLSLVDEISQKPISDLQREYALNLKAIDKEELSHLKNNNMVPLLKNGKHIGDTFEDESKSYRASFRIWESWYLQEFYKQLK